MGLPSPTKQDHTQKGPTTAMKKFEEWLYWEGTRYIVMFYLFIVPLFAIFGAKEIALIKFKKGEEPSISMIHQQIKLITTTMIIIIIT